MKEEIARGFCLLCEYYDICKNDLDKEAANE